MRSDSGPEVDTVGIDVEKNDSRRREFLIWIRFDNTHFGEKIPFVTRGLYDSQIMSSGGECFAPFENIKSVNKECLPHYWEDLLISEICPLDENVSHHICKCVIACMSADFNECSGETNRASEDM